LIGCQKCASDEFDALLFVLVILFLILKVLVLCLALFWKIGQPLKDTLVSVWPLISTRFV